MIRLAGDARTAADQCGGRAITAIAASSAVLSIAILGFLPALKINNVWTMIAPPATMLTTQAIQKQAG